MHKIVLRLAALTAGVSIPVVLATSALAGTTTTSGSQPQVNHGVCYYGPIAEQSAYQSNYTAQSAQGGTATSNQIAVPVNLPIALLSPGANNGSVTQSPSSSANANASNTNSTVQTVTQTLGL